MMNFASTLKNNALKIFLVALLFVILAFILLYRHSNEETNKFSTSAKDSSDIISTYDDWLAQEDDNVDIESVEGSVRLYPSSEVVPPGYKYSDPASCWENPPCYLDSGMSLIYELDEIEEISRITFYALGFPAEGDPTLSVQYYEDDDWTNILTETAPAGGKSYDIELDPHIYTSKVRILNSSPEGVHLEITDEGFALFSPVYNLPGSITSAATQIDGQEGSAEKTLIRWTSFLPTQTTPADTSISYQFRVSADGSNWGSWTDAVQYAGDPIDLTGLIDNRYLQVKATLSNTDGVSSPQIDDYTINFHNNQKPNQPTAQTAIIGD